MANELTLTFTVNFTKTGSKSRSELVTKQITVAGGISQSVENTIDVTDTVLDFPTGIGTIGVVILENLDNANFIEIGEDGSSYPIKLKPGEAFPIRWNGSAIHGKADSTPCKLAATIFED